METEVKHKHVFKVDKNNKGICPCGEERQFMVGDNDNPREQTSTLIKAGNPNYLDPPHQKTPEAKAGKGGGLSNRERHDYYELHKDEIISDIKIMGPTQARKKWGIPASTWTATKKGLAYRWGLTKTKEKPAKKINKEKPEHSYLHEKVHLSAGTTYMNFKVDVRLPFGIVGLAVDVPFFDLPKNERDWLCEVVDLFKRAPKGEKL